MFNHQVLRIYMVQLYHQQLTVFTELLQLSSKRSINCCSWCQGVHMYMYVGYVHVRMCQWKDAWSQPRSRADRGYRERKEHWDSSNTLMYMVLCTVCLSVCTCCVVTVVQLQCLFCKYVEVCIKVSVHSSSQQVNRCHLLLTCCSVQKLVLLCVDPIAHLSQRIHVR